MRTTLLVACSLLSFAGVASDEYASSLEETQRRAMERAVEVELALAEADRARGEASAWTGRSLPAISAFSQLGVGAGFTPFGFERPVPWQVGVGVRGSWTLVDPSGWAAATSARRTARGREALLAWARAQARRDATMAYCDAWSGLKAARLLESAAEDAVSAMSAIAELVDAGIRPPADSSRARADAMDVQAQAVFMQGEAKAACARLQALVGADISASCRLTAPSKERPEVGPTLHPALVAAEEALGAARAQGDRSRFAHLPTLSADGTAAEYIVADRGTGLGWAANVTLDVPLTIATSGPGDLAVARAEKRRAEAELERQRRDLEATAAAARARLDSARHARVARRTALEAAHDAWTRVDARYREGLEDITSWLEARRAMRQAEVALVSAEAAVVSGVAEVEGVDGVTN